MTKRTKKLLSLLLATTMVFSLNTTVFAEEVAVDSVEDAVEATVDAVDEVAEEATVDNTDDAVVAASDVEEEQGIKYPVKDGVRDTEHPVTNIKFESNGAKKNEQINVATITNTTDPVSWNGAYAADLIATVLHGGEGEDTYLNNNSKVNVSENNPAYGVGLEGLYGADQNKKYEVIEVGSGQYLFVEYGVAHQTDLNPTLVYENSKFVAGYDDAVPTIGALTTPATLPTTEWDGRFVDYNKSGDHKFATGKKEALDVSMAFVTYANGTVTEVKDVTLGGVKVDKKTQKAASVEFDASLTTKSYVDVDPDDPTKTKTLTTTIPEHKTMGDLPFFTISAKVAKDAKSYKKDIAAKLKDKKFFFGITQRAVDVEVAATADATMHNIIGTYSDKIEAVAEDDNGTVSPDGLKKVSDNYIKDEIESKVADDLTSTGSFAERDYETIVVDGFAVSKFTEKKANVAICGWVGDDFGWEYKELKTLSAAKGDKGDYSLGTGTVAGETVYTLDFKDGGNFVYRPLTADNDGTADKPVETRIWDDRDNLAQLGYKWAFRKTPSTDGKKTKTFRYGIFKADNNGFVYSVDETAVDSVEEAF